MFGSIAFISYGFFWISFVLTLTLPKTGAVVAPNGNALGCYMLIWGVFTVGMFIATLKRAPIAMQFLFATVWVLFFLLAAHFFAGSAGVLTAAGCEGIVCGLTAIYIAIAELVNETFGKTIFPIGKKSSPSPVV